MNVFAINLKSKESPSFHLLCWLKGWVVSSWQQKMEIILQGAMLDVLVATFMQRERRRLKIFFLRGAACVPLNRKWISRFYCFACRFVLFLCSAASSFCIRTCRFTLSSLRVDVSLIFLSGSGLFPVTLFLISSQLSPSPSRFPWSPFLFVALEFYITNVIWWPQRLFALSLRWLMGEKNRVSGSCFCYSLFVFLLLFPLLKSWYELKRFFPLALLVRLLKKIDRAKL